jgi:hypothetical protein
MSTSEANRRNEAGTAGTIPQDYEDPGINMD